MADTPAHVEGRPLTPYRIVSGWLTDANGSRIDPSGKMVYLAADVDAANEERDECEKATAECALSWKARLDAADAAREALRAELTTVRTSEQSTLEASMRWQARAEASEAEVARLRAQLDKLA